jgi:hypothetical protein
MAPRQPMMPFGGPAQFPGPGGYPVPAQQAAYGPMPGVWGPVPAAYQYVAPPVPMPRATSPAAVPPSGVIQAGFQKPAAGTASEPSHASAPEGLQSTLMLLRDSLYPSQREWAAGQLATEAHGNPQILQALLRAAKEDPAPTVRAACVRCVAKMGVSNPDVVTGLRMLQTDHDAQVRQEVEQALAALAPGSASARPANP